MEIFPHTLHPSRCAVLLKTVKDDIRRESARVAPMDAIDHVLQGGRLFHSVPKGATPGGQGKAAVLDRPKNTLEKQSLGSKNRRHKKSSRRSAS
jgi:hypothetical protein